MSTSNGTPFTAPPEQSARGFFNEPDQQCTAPDPGSTSSRPSNPLGTPPMASFKGPIRAHINSVIHAEFPPTKVEALQREGSFHHELELWLELQEEAIPSQWRRDWSAVSFKYALAALAGEGIQWEPRRQRRVYTGDLALCQVGSVAQDKLLRAGSYGGRNGRVALRQWYVPEHVTTEQQGDGNLAVVDGEFRQISWPVFGPRDPRPVPSLPFDDVFGDRLF